MLYRRNALFAVYLLGTSPWRFLKDHPACIVLNVLNLAVGTAPLLCQTTEEQSKLGIIMRSAMFFLLG